jgi:PAS domain S-box-containing protein
MSTEKQKTILLVEDEVLIALDEKMTLEEYGYQVILVDTGEKAVETINIVPDIDLILMDIDLGSGIDGTEAAERILENRDIPIVFLSSHTEREVVEKTEGITSYGYIVKNTGETVMMASVKMAFRLFNSKENVKKQALRNKAIVHALPDLMFVIDKNGRYKEVHAPDESLLPIPAYKIIGKKIHDIFGKEKAEDFLKVFNVCIKTGKTQVFEYRLDVQDEEHYFKAHITRLDENNILSIVHDITERKQRKEKIENLNSLLMSIRNVNQLIVQEDDILTIMNESCKILQEARQYLNIEIALMNKSDGQIKPVANAGSHSLRQWTVTPDGEGTAPECIKTAVATKAPLLIDNPKDSCIEGSHYEDNNTHPSIIIPMFEKETLTGLLTACMRPGHRFSSEEVDLLEEVAGDLGFASTKYETDKILKENEASLLAIFDSVDEPVYVADPETYEVIFTNKVLKDHFGPLNNQKCYEYLQHRKTPCPFCTNEKIFGKYSGKSYVWEFQNKVNKHWYRCIDKAIPWPDGRMVRYEMAIDITDTKQIQEALRISEQNYVDIFQSVSEGIVYTTLSGKILSVNSPLEKILNIPGEKLVKRNVLAIARELLSIKEAKKVLPLLKNIVQGKNIQPFQFQYKNQYLEISTSINRQTKRITSLIRDITQQKIAEEARQQSEFLFHSVWDVSMDGMRLTDKDGKIILVNDAFCRFVEKDKSELENQTLGIIYDPSINKNIILKYKKNYLNKTFYPYIERELTLWNGKRMWFGVSISTIKIPDGHDLVLSVFRDITFRKIQNNITHAVITAPNLNEFYEAIRSELAKLMDTTNFLIAFYDKNTDMFLSPFEKDQKDNIFSWPAEKSLSGYVVRKNKPMLLNKKDILNLASKGEIEIIGSISEVWLGVPLKKGKDISGVLVVQSYHNPHAYDNNCLDILQTVSDQLSIYIDIKESDEALKSSNSLLNATLESTADGILVVSRAGEITRYNQKFAEMWSIPQEILSNGDDAAAINHVLAQLIDPESFSKKVEHLYAHPEESSFDQLVFKDGRIFERYSLPQKINSNIVGRVWSFRDITHHKQVEEEIKQQLSEKEILLKEVHHRIKNNISSIESLLSLQAKTVKNPDARSALEASIGRVKSMGVLYEKLLNSIEYKNTSAKKYIESLIDIVLELFPDKEKITVQKKIDDVILETKKMFPLGIIINELLTNTFKYAFRDNKSGVINISLTQTAKNITLIIQDNGTGFPESFNFNKSKGFGLMLVNIMSKQIGGNLFIENKNGAHVALTLEV